MLLGAALGNGAEPYQPTALGTGRCLCEQQLYLGDELLHLARAEAGLAVRIDPTEQPECRVPGRYQPVEIAGGIKEPAGWIRHPSYPLIGHTKLDLNAHPLMIQDAWLGILNCRCHRARPEQW